MSLLTDAQIAEQAVLQPIEVIAEKIGLPLSALERYGAYKAKVDAEATLARPKRAGKLILVSAINPTPAGEGKTTVTIGLADALNRLGRQTVVAIREPSLGPVFGVKGGATGGGLCAGGADGGY
nr:formate--tetrahydrofolate ligase [Rappaport israeli]